MELTGFDWLAVEPGTRTEPTIQMKINTYIRGFIRHHGAMRTVVVSTLCLMVLVAVFTMLVDRLLTGVVHTDLVYFSILITVLIGPLFLYSFVNLISQLDRSEDKLRALSVMDDLTDVYNRRYFMEQAEKELQKAQRYGTVFSIMALDIDHFKQINDSYGHQAGDVVLQAMANSCMNNVRTMDVFARVGGEEYFVLVPESDKIDVEAFADKVRQAVEQATVMYDKHEINFTTSIGLKTYSGDTHSLDAMLKDVGEALQEAKNQGRNRVVIYDTDRLNSTA